ncbi:MAG: FHA domain-containing protein [Planctomycetes bacterium]|nr:FHA domain-containing protein [Planctomycetota bacterium]
MASLLIVSGPNEGDYYPIGKRTLVVGRDQACPVQLTDELVSRRHLQIRGEGDGRFVLLDMKSANGTWLNGRQIEVEIELADNDEISVGNSKLVFTRRDFPDRESALLHYKQRGQRGQATIKQ